MKIKALIVDDDRLVCEQLSDLVESHFPEAAVCKICRSGEDGVQAIREHQPQIVFLDIMMTGMNGFEMLKHVSQYSFEVIFVTAHNEYAIQAIRHSALDYLLKPIQTSEFEAAVGRYREKLNLSHTLEQRIETLKHNLSEKEISEHKLVINSNRGSEIVKMAEIVYCSSESNYTELHIEGGKKILASRTLGFFEEALSSSGIFIRAHRSTLVNKLFVVRYHSNGMLELRNGQKLEVSQRRSADVRKELQLTNPRENKKDSSG